MSFSKMVLEQHWEHFLPSFWRCKRNATCVGSNTFCFSGSLKSCSMTFIEKQHYRNHMAPKSDIGERSLAMPNECSGHFPPLQWTRQTFAVVGIFPFVPMGMLRFDGSGHFPFICNGHVGHSLFWASFLFIQTGMLRFGCSGHPFLSFKRACCVLAVLGIFSLHEVGHVAFGHFGAFFLSCKWACRILVVLAMLSFH